MSPEQSWAGNLSAEPFLCAIIYSPVLIEIFIEMFQKNIFFQKNEKFERKRRISNSSWPEKIFTVEENGIIQSRFI